MKKPKQSRRCGSIPFAQQKQSHFVELLELRRLLSGVIETGIPTFLSFNNTPGTDGFSPAAISQAYGYNSLGVTADGAGQTVAIVDLLNDPTIVNDVDQFSSQFGLPSFVSPGGPTLNVVGQTGGALPSTGDADDIEETSLDVEWVHALAPQANILVVETSSDLPADFGDVFIAAATAAATPGVSVVSMSLGLPEGSVGSVVSSSNETTYDNELVTPSGHTGVTFVAADGDSGSTATGTNYPAASPNVVSVGGTSLTLSSGNYSSESVWYSGINPVTHMLEATGGGSSLYEAQPSYQSAITLAGTKRAVPDVAFDADPSTGVPIYDSTDGGSSPWAEVGGTSFSAPAWAAIIARADQERVQQGYNTLTSSAALNAIYGTLSSTDFHDITSGSNGTFSALTGYDLVTGRGTPVANNVVTDLVNPVQNAGFETGSLTDWTGFAGNTTISSSTKYSGSYSAEGMSTTGVGGSGGIKQMISNLLPYTTYSVSLEVESTNGQADLGVDYGTNAPNITSASTSWTTLTNTFNTGASTSATIYISHISASSGDASYFDAFKLVDDSVVTAAENFGFESGSLGGWTGFAGATSVSNSTKYSGIFSADAISTTGVGGSGGIDQTISGLLPYATYTFTVQAESTNGTADLGVDYGSSAPNATSTSTGWTTLTVTINTGSNTSATIYLSHISSATGDSSYFDDITLSDLSVANNLGFETGTLSSWTTYVGSVSATNSTSHSGSYSASATSTSGVGGSGGIYQTIYGLSTNTPYTISVEVKSTNGQADLGVDYGSSSPNVYSTSTGWTTLTITINTGSANSAKIYLTHISSATGDISYFDDVTLGDISATNNFGFEAGSLSDWTGFAGSTTTNSGTKYSGSYSAEAVSTTGVGGAGGIYQSISGLQTNTTYTVSVEVQSNHGTADLGVDYGTSTPNVTSTSTGWTTLTITFNTGSSTSASIYLSHVSSVLNDYSYFDDVSVVKAQ